MTHLQPLQATCSMEVPVQPATTISAGAVVATVVGPGQGMDTGKTQMQHADVNQNRRHMCPPTTLKSASMHACTFLNLKLGTKMRTSSPIFLAVRWSTMLTSVKSLVAATLQCI